MDVLRKNVFSILLARLGLAAGIAATTRQEKGGDGRSMLPFSDDPFFKRPTPRSSGVVVERVDPASRAGEAGLRRGDVILEVNRSPIKNIEDYQKTLSNLKKEERALLLINRQGRTLFMSVGSA